MPGMLLSPVVLFAIVVCVKSASVTKAVAQTGCVHQGKTYAVGEKTDSACQPCECTPSGRMACLVIDCFFPAPCVDAVHEKGKCCATCPTGPNCKYGSHIIKKGEVYKPDANTECSCSTGMGFGFFGSHAHEANCTKTASVV